MKAKKLLVVILVCMFVLIPVIGCTTKPAPTASGTSSSVIPTGAKPASISLNYAYSGTVDIKSKLLEFGKQFKQQYGIDVKVSLSAGASDLDVLKTSVAAGSGPDVWTMDVNWFSAWKDTVIQPVSPYFNKDFYNQFVPSAVNIWKANDNYYAIPASYSVVAMLYNKKLVADAGITIGKTWTFDEFEQDLAKASAYYKDKSITYSDGKKYPYYILGTSHTMYYWWMALGEFQGTPLSKTNNICQPAFVSSILKAAEWRSKGYLNQGSEVLPSSTQVAFSSACNVVFWPTGDWTITALYRQSRGLETDALAVKVDYASIAAPTGPDGKSYAEVYNAGIVMNKNLKGWNAVAAANLIKFLGVDAWEEISGPGSGNYCMPALKTYANQYSSWFEKPEQSQGFIDTINNGVISSPDYNAGGIDLTSNYHEATLAGINEADKEKPQFDSAKVKSIIENTLIAQQKLANLQMQENEIKLDNPDAVIK